MKNILFINATSYNITLPEEAYELRLKYSRVKNYVKKRRIANLNPNTNNNTRSYSIGLLRIATILHYNGYDVRYIDFDDIDINEIQSFISNFDVVAFSAVTPTVPKCAELCEKIKSFTDSIIVAIGGPHINVAKKMTQKRYSCFDIYADGFDIEAAAKIASISPASLRLPDTFVDYSLLPYPLTEYVLNTFTTLGCNYMCDYCQDHLIPYYENPDVTGLKQFIGNIPRGTRIHFFDSTIGVNYARTKAVCNALIEMDHGFLLSCDARAEAISPEIVKLLEAAGFTEINLGMETADDNVLKNNNRYLSHSKMVNKLETIRKNSGLYIAIYNAVGIPGSTLETTEKSRNALKNLLLDDLIDDIKSCVYVPYPMDEKNYLEREVIIENYDWSLYDRQSYPVYRLKNMTSQEIWTESLNLLQTSVYTWLLKYRISSIDELPNEYWIEYLNKCNGLNSFTKD